MKPITEKDVDELKQSMTNYFLLVACGAIRDENLGPDFLDVIREIDKKGIHIFEY